MTDFVNLDAVDNAAGTNAGGLTAGVTIGGFQPTDVLRVTAPDGLFYTAILNAQTFGMYGTRFRVIPDGDTAQTQEYSGATTSTSADLARQNFVNTILTGASAYTFFIFDGFTDDNEGGLSLRIDPFGYDWPWPINWKDGYTVTREYRTDIFTSRSGREQRRALRSTPRITLSGTSLLTGDDYREFKGLMTLAQHRPFTMPDWSQRIKLTDAAEAGDTAISVDGNPTWLVAGRAVYLHSGTGRATRVFVESVFTDLINLVAPLEDDWPSGTTLYPGCIGNLPGELAVKTITNSVATASVTLRVQPGSEPVDPEAAETLLDGREISTLSPNWADGVDQSLIFAAEQVDFGRGTITQTYPIDFPTNVRRASYMAATVAEAQVMIDLFDRMKGQRGEFYLPSGENDLPPKTGITSGASTLTVAGTDTAAFYDDSTVYSALCVRLRNGSAIYRKVTGINTSGGDTVITISGTWPSTVTAANILMVSWMPVYRFASDQLTIEYRTDSVATFDVSLKMLENLEEEDL